MLKILIVEDEAAIRRVLARIIGESFSDVQVSEAGNGSEALAALENNKFSLVLSDIKMPAPDGVELLTIAKSKYPALPFIMLSGHGDISMAVNCMKLGAFDYIEKPPDLQKLVSSIRSALNFYAEITAGEDRNTDTSSADEADTSGIIGESAAIQKLRRQIAKIAPTQARVLICGESGTGKELIARALWNNSSRKNEAFIELNCAAIPSELIESELFGHEKGSFTSAVSRKTGKFEQANGGTLFLDEVGDMSLSAQAKVLRVLQEGKLTHIGGNAQIDVDVRVFAATNKNLEKEIEKGNFREDLYHRLSVIEIVSPPLRQRPDDIPLLAKHFLKQIGRREGIKTGEIPQSVLDDFYGRRWSGNVRELQNAVERFVLGL